MAREFNGSSNYLSSAATVDLSSLGGGVAATFSFWLWANTFSTAVDRTYISAADASSANGLLFSQSSFWGQVFIGILSASSSHFTAWYFTPPSTAAWHQYIFELLLDGGGGVSSVNLWIDNAAVTLTSLFNNGPFIHFANSTHYLASDTGGGGGYAGCRFAEYAIYSGSLSSGNRASLQTSSPAVVGSPLFHWPLCGTASPEPYNVGGVNFTVTGATFVADPATLTGSLCGGGSSNGSATSPESRAYALAIPAVLQATSQVSAPATPAKAVGSIPSSRIDTPVSVGSATAKAIAALPSVRADSNVAPISVPADAVCPVPAPTATAQVTSPGAPGIAWAMAPNYSTQNIINVNAPEAKAVAWAMAPAMTATATTTAPAAPGFAIGRVPAVTAGADSTFLPRLPTLGAG